MIRLVSVILMLTHALMAGAAQQQVDDPPLANEKHSVPLEDMILDDFENFSQRVLPLSQASHEDLQSAYNRLRPFCHGEISNCFEPAYESVSAADQWLSADSLVLGYIDGNGQSYAFPFQVLAFHNTLNDVLADQPIVVAYCLTCNSASIYSRLLEGQTISFGNTDAYYQNTGMFYDVQTESLWLATDGRSIFGEFTDKRLDPLPSVISTWERWKREHQTSLVLARQSDYVDYTRSAVGNYELRLSTGQFMFPVSDEVRNDARLKPAEPVLVVETASQSVAYPLTLLGDAATRDTINGTTIVILSLTAGPAAGAYNAQLADGTIVDLTFDAATGNWRENATGSMIDFSGAVVSGPLEGGQLVPLSSHYMFWYAANATIPGVQVYNPSP